MFQVIRSLGIPRTPLINNNSAYINSPLFTGSDDYGGAGSNLHVGLNSMMDSLDYMGVKICKSNHIPKTDLQSANIGSSKYNLNCAATGYTTGSTSAAISAGGVFSIYGIIFQAEALAALSLMGMKVDTIQDVRRNTQFTVASMMKGTGVLKPEMVKLLVSGASGAVSRANMFIHFNSLSTVGGTGGSNNLTSGFAAEYAVTQ